MSRPHLRGGLVWVIFPLATAGCVDGNLTKRNDAQYVAVPSTVTTGVVYTPNDRLPSSALPQSVAGKQSPASDGYSLVPALSPQEQKQRDAQSELENALADLGKK